MAAVLVFGRYPTARSESTRIVTDPAAVRARPPLSARTVRTLDACRALAALAVVVQHARLALFVDPRNITAVGPVGSIVYWASGFGHEAVVVFFVLSGALVGGGVVAAVSSEAWSWRDYVIRRLSRLYVVLIPALILAALWDHAGITLFPSGPDYRDIISAVTLGSHTLVIHSQSAWAFAGNAMFLMTIYVPVFGSAGALWSLSNEFWYYLLFPCVALAIVGRRNSLRSLVNIALTLAILSVIGREIAEWLSVWLLGVLVVTLPRMQLGARLAERTIAVSFAVFVVIAALIRTRVNMVSLPGDLCVGAGFAFFLYCMICCGHMVPHAGRTHRADAIWKRFASFSYTLYLFHQPPLAFASGWLVATNGGRWQPSPWHCVALLAICVALVGYSYVWSRFTEAHTDSLRRYVHRLLERTGRSAAPVAVRAPAGMLP